MENTNFIQSVGLVASIILPIFNIPLMIRIIKRRSSEDVSLIWVLGVYVCLVALLPAGLTSSDSVFKIFSFTNFCFFSGVTFCVVYFRLKKRGVKKNSLP